MLQNYIDNQEKLITQLTELKLLIMTKGKCITRNSDKYPFTIRTSDYPFSHGYNFFIDFDCQASIKFELKDPLALEKVVTEIDRYISAGVFKIERAKLLFAESNIEHLKAVRASILERFKLLESELSTLKKAFINDDIYKKLLGINYLNNKTLSNI